MTWRIQSVWEAQLGQAIWVEGGLVEVLGRFIGAVDIFRWWLAEADVPILLETIIDWVYLSFRGDHFEVELARFAAL